MIKAARIALFSVALLALVLGTIRWWQREIPQQPGELRIVHSIPRLDIDPRVPRGTGMLERRVLMALWEPLVLLDARGVPTPGAAESWTISEDGRRVTFRLRRDLRWSNGAPITAADFLRTIEWAVRERGAPAFFAMLRYADGESGKTSEAPAPTIRVIDDRTLEFEAPRAVHRLMETIAAGEWVPMYAEGQSLLLSGEYRRDPAGLVTNGPFLLARAAPDYWLLKKNPHYHAAEQVALNAVRLIPTETPDNYSLLIAADLADLSDSAPYQPARMRTVEGPARMHAENIAQVSVLHFNLQHAPLDDARVRRALALALDRDALAAAMTARGGRGAFSCEPGADDRPAARTLEENLDEARRLLAEAGYPDGRGMPVLRLPLVDTAQPNPMAYYCADQWRSRLGVTVYVIPLPSAEVAARLERGEFDIMHYAWITSAYAPSVTDGAPFERVPPAFRPVLSARFKELMERELRSPPEERAALRRQLELALLEDMPLTPVVFYRRYQLLSPSVLGWKEDLYGVHPFSELRLAEKATALAP